MFLCLLKQMIEAGEGTILGINSFVIGDVISKVDLRRRIDRRKPYGIHAKLLQVVQMFRHAIQIAEAVTIGAAEAAWVSILDESEFSPGVVITRTCCIRFGRSRSLLLSMYRLRERRSHQGDNGDERLQGFGGH